MKDKRKFNIWLLIRKISKIVIMNRNFIDIPLMWNQWTYLLKIKQSFFILSHILAKFLMTHSLYQYSQKTTFFLWATYLNNINFLFTSHYFLDELLIKEDKSKISDSHKKIIYPFLLKQSLVNYNSLMIHLQFRTLEICQRSIFKSSIW